MAQHKTGLLERVLMRRSRAFWSRAAKAAATTDLSVLRRQRNQARILRHKLDELTHTADSRLALPRIGSSSFPKPPGTDWSWRPQLWRGALPVQGLSAVESKTMLGDEVTIFHDCQISELTLRQLRNMREADLAPYGLRMDVFRFDGSFLSLVLNLPQSGCEGLMKTHLVRLDAIVEVEKPLEIFARLNVRHGPNTEQIVRELPLDGDQIMVEFDLAYTKLNEKRVDSMWIDLIFEGPEMNQVTLRDVTLSRNPRAEL
ncbi:DUF6478 family protein [Pseudooctadecabacter jejudonensis]|uniref:Uncharacterized protein n=1 Tax=Pseudooctadecabacter jejudonensis TaxID=1391910 RepID=A0A1Y5S114_9RHOB|nr:DUF6478 family protein [Pseudooctadecabacter jejudonensis]SLN30037.1 hypothetical protein PSJ8397_01356 [Pseudooctadecabacter jejudonensis]